MNKNTLSLDYNPFLRTYKFTIDNKPLTVPEGNWLLGLKDYPLQQLLSKDPSIIKGDQSWTGLVSEICQYCASTGINNFLINFTGNNRDYADLNESVVSYNKQNDTDIKCNHLFTKYDPAAINLDKISHIINDTSLSQIKYIQDTIEEFNEQNQGDIRIVISGIYSSGKTTILNALLHKDRIQGYATGTDPTTSCVVEMACSSESSPDFTCQDLEGKTLEIPLSTNDKYKNIKSLKDENIFTIKTQEYFPFLDKNFYDKVTICDTPGFGNASNINDERITQSYIEKHDALIIYITNIEGAVKSDNTAQIEFLKSVLASKGQYSARRFIFVLNHADSIDIDQDDDNPDPDPYNNQLKEIVNEFKAILNDDNLVVIPVMGRYAELYYQNANGHLSVNTKSYSDYKVGIDNFKYLQPYKDCSHVDAAITRDIEDKIKQAKSDEEKGYYYSGIPTLEAVINQYLKDYGATNKVADAVISVLRAFENCYNKYNQEEIEKVATNKVQKLQHIKTQYITKMDANMEPKITSYKKMIREIRNEFNDDFSRNESSFRDQTLDINIFKSQLISLKKEKDFEISTKNNEFCEELKKVSASVIKDVLREGFNEINIDDLPYQLPDLAMEFDKELENVQQQKVIVLNKKNNNIVDKIVGFFKKLGDKFKKNNKSPIQTNSDNQDANEDYLISIKKQFDQQYAVVEKSFERRLAKYKLMGILQIEEFYNNNVEGQEALDEEALSDDEAKALKTAIDQIKQLLGE